MKKTGLGLLLSLCMMISFCMTAFAGNKVDSINVEAVIYDDGSMYVTQVWEGDFYEGTENYIPMKAPDYLTISDLQVSDAQGTYEFLPEWDVDADFEEKSGKCGINETYDGYEICFGISGYGHNRYAIEYRLDHAVAGYTDQNGMNFRFINDQMNTTPTDASIAIWLADGTPITDKNADIWAFGYDGQVEFSNGAVWAYTEKPLKSSNHMTIMAGFDKDLLHPDRQVSESFDTVKERAFEGSDYDSEDDPPLWKIILGAVVMIGIPLFLVIFFQNHIKKTRKKKLEQFAEEKGYFREVPNGGDLNASYKLGKQFELCEDGTILAVGMLRLIDLGCLEPIVEETAGFMGKTKETANLRLAGIRRGQMNKLDEDLYRILEQAAGTDGVLQEKELERFAGRHDKVLRNYLNECENAGKKYLDQKHCLKTYRTPSRLKDLTESGERELGELLGLKKYLEDFSLIAERGIKELPIWKELLIYAMLFGIADRLAEQIKKLYPDLAPEVAEYTRSMSSASSYQYMMYRNMRQAEERREQQKRSRGSGGSASFGGGGGSIGGGSGGGSR